MGLLPLFTLLASCDNSPANLRDVSGSFVGRASGTNAFVTVVTNGTDVRAYVCDGTPETERSISEWFKGTQRANALDITSVSGGARLVADVGEQVVTGRIEMSGRPELTFTASLAAGSSGFYLYKYEHGGELYWAGWVVLPGDETRGSMAQPTATSLGVSLDVPARSAQVPGLGTVSTGRLTPGNVIAGFGGGCCCCN